MSLSCSDCFSNLLCEEDSSSIISCGGDALPEYSSDLESRRTDFEESIAGLLEDERDLVSINYGSSHESTDASARAHSVAWILKDSRGCASRNSHYSFITAGCAGMWWRRVKKTWWCDPDHDETAAHRILYGAVYGELTDSRNTFCFGAGATLLRFSAINGISLGQLLGSFSLLPSLAENGWMAIATIIRYMLVISCQDGGAIGSFSFGSSGAEFIFEPKHIQRMELLVLRVLDWRLRSVAPFFYLGFFALKIDPTGTYTGYLTSSAEDIIFSIIQETRCIGKSSFAKKRRANRLGGCYKCARWTCDTRCKSVGFVSKNREDKIAFIKDGLSKESMDHDIHQILDAHPSGYVHRELMALWIQFKDERKHYSHEKLVSKDPV
ncbi:hypothetical protein OROGR_003613 [Orobanche gracilis]